MHIRKYLALAVAGALSISAAVATTLERMSMQEMAAAASVAVVGEVTAARTARTDAGLVTISTITVIDTMWGNSAATLEVTVPGGSTVSGRIRVGEGHAGAPVLLGRQKALFLLSRGEDNSLSIVGFSQGMLPIKQTAEGQMLLLPGASKPMALAAAMKQISASKAAPANSDGLQR